MSFSFKSFLFFKLRKDIKGSFQTANVLMHFFPEIVPLFEGNDIIEESQTLAVSFPVFMLCGTTQILQYSILHRNTTYLYEKSLGVCCIKTNKIWRHT